METPETVSIEKALLNKVLGQEKNIPRFVPTDLEFGTSLGQV
jgi:hypothetical protein